MCKNDKKGLYVRVGQVGGGVRMLTVTVQPSGHNLLLGLVQRASDSPFHAFRNTAEESRF